jgi:hypothetical protein
MALKFRMMRDLVEAAQALKRCIIKVDRANLVLKKRSMITLWVNLLDLPFLRRENEGRLSNIKR